MHGEEDTLEYTPTWVVASVCGVIVAISILVERSLHLLGKYLKKSSNNPLYDALQKIKEELMLLGFISLLLTISGTGINSICISRKLAHILLPCSGSKTGHAHDESKIHSLPFHVFSSRHLLSDVQLPDPSTLHCTSKGKVPMLYATALHHLHLFIFILAFAHVLFCALTIIFGGQKINKWRRWEDSATNMDVNEVLKTNITYVENITKRMGFGSMLGWLHSFFKHFHGSVTKSDYLTLRLGFIKKHCPGNPRFNFHGYMMRHLEADFKKVVGINWYLWLFVVIFFLVNIIDWDTYLFESFIPFSLLLAVGTKLEHVITELAEEVTQEHVVVEGDMVVRPSDEHFWFGKPKFMLILIHFILFQNSFELAYLFFIMLEYHHDSCIIGSKASIIVRLVLGAFVRFVCSYNTLPLYTIVTQMGSSFKKQIFEENIRKGLEGWLQHARDKGKSFQHARDKPSRILPLPLPYENYVDDIVPSPIFQHTKESMSEAPNSTVQVAASKSEPEYGKGD